MPKPQPKPDRFKRPELQSAYEMGWDQEYDHDSFVLLDRFEWLADESLGAERMAAMLDGAADALHALARARRAEARATGAAPLSDVLKDLDP